MKIKGDITRKDLIFNFPAGTSRGVLYKKPSWFIRLSDGNNTGYGEVSLIPGLSVESVNQTESELTGLMERISSGNLPPAEEFNALPAIRFGYETALADLRNAGDCLPYPGDFSKGTLQLEINGLVWMGTKEFMLQQIEDKLRDGFRCVKLKIGAIDFDSECDLLTHIRNRYGPQDIELRVDANGAFSPEEAPNKLAALSKFDIHSIEQPIKAGQWNKMAELCKNSPIPIALDEELIGVVEPGLKQQLLDTVKPQYIILKPSLVGGCVASDEWISMAENRNIGWWATSALEANIGLNAIAQWVSHKPGLMPQGLGTGKLFENNIPSPLRVTRGHILHDSTLNWNLSEIG